MDTDLISQIITAGAMGASIYCIFRVYDLLKTEQEKEQPRPTFIRTIYVSMGFAVFMTLLSLGIEVVRHNLKMHEDSLPKQLDLIAKNNYSAFDEFGNPKSIVIEVEGDTIELAKKSKKSVFEIGTDTLLLNHQHITNDKSKLLIYHSNRLLGYINNIPKNPPTPIPVAAPIKFEPEELLTLAIEYAPSSSKTSSYHLPSDYSKANQYLEKIIVLDDEIKANIQEKAVKILTQPISMAKLTDAQYEKLIETLQKGAIRSVPWNLYELAQVYLSRHLNESLRQEDDKTNYLASLRKYTEVYADISWLNSDTIKYKTEYDWYKKSLEKIN